MSFGDGTITRVEALRQLRIGPKLFRQMTEDYRAYLGPLPMGGVTPEQMARLGTILELRAEGRAREEIVARLEAAPALDVGGAATTEDPSDPLVALRQEIRRAEERQAEDRDRLLTALIRTQQELAHLRQEMVASKSRRDRKKNGFFARFFG